jgi:hypothetical protein
MHAATFASQSRSAGVGLEQQLVGQVLNVFCFEVDDRWRAVYADQFRAFAKPLT